MKILLNGNTFEAKNQGLASILINFGEHIAISINGSVIPKKAWQEVELKEDDLPIINAKIKTIEKEIKKDPSKKKTVSDYYEQ